MSSTQVMTNMNLIKVACLTPFGASRASARVKGRNSHGPARRDLKKDQVGDVTDCEGLEPKRPTEELLEDLGYNPETTLAETVDPCLDRTERLCITLVEALELYPGLDISRCSGPEDCDGECRFHTTGLLCDEDDGPFFHLSPICSVDVSINPPIAPPETDAPTVTSEIRVPQEGGENTKVGFQGQSLFARLRNSKP